MRNQGMDQDVEMYEKKYQAGYGVQYPEGHIIRFYERVLRYELGMHGGRILDFGCGNGIHSKYFAEKGFETYGVDVSRTVIEEIKNEGKLKSENYHLITPGQNLMELFEKDFFDVILANQSLYYLDNESLRRCVDELYALTKDNGVCFCTMMSEKNAYYSLVTENYANGFSHVVLDGRLKEETNVNFTTSVEQLKQRFSPYVPLHIGQYEPFSYLDCTNEDGCSHHYMFIGAKRKDL